MPVQRSVEQSAGLFLYLDLMCGYRRIIIQILGIIAPMGKLLIKPLKSLSKGPMMDKTKADINWNKIALYLKIGIVGATIILVGDLLMGWGVRDESMTGIESQLSPYLDIPDSRMILASLCGLLGVPIAVVGHIGIYKLLKPYSSKYARLYAIGIVGFLIVGGAGVHVSSVEAAFFYKNMAVANPDIVFTLATQFALYFLLPLYAVLLPCWFIMVYAHIRAISMGLSPYPRWCVAFSMLVGTLLVCLIGLVGNYAIVNALMVGAFSIGNVWTLAGHLALLPKAKQAQ